MAFNIVLYTNNSEPIKVDKDLTTISTVNGTLRDGSSLTAPNVLIEGSLGTYSNCNYCYIAEFHRFYFVGPISVVTNNLLLLPCRVDALSSWKQQIRTNSAIIKRQAFDNNLYLNDGSLKCYQNPIVQTKTFPNGFTNEEFVFIVACPAGQAGS